MTTAPSTSTAGGSPAGAGKIHYITPMGIASAWVANEIGIVRKHSVAVQLHSLHTSRQKFFSSDWAKELDQSTRVIYPIGVPKLLASALAAPFLFKGRFFAALWNAIFGERETLRNRAAVFAHFFVACHWARQFVRRGESVPHIHSQWIHSGGTVGMYGAWLLGTSFSFTGHAADLFRERVALRDKIRRADFIICISEFHRQFFLKEGARPEQLHITYCGIDLSHFVAKPPPPRAGRLPRILSSGRLVDKKGFNVLVDACKILKDRGLAFECIIGGDGPLEKPLREQIARLDLADRVRMTAKPLTQEELPGFMHGGDVYTLACVWAKDNDVDGRPQMLMEAMACGLPAVSTRLVGIPDLIEDKVTGLLVEPENAPQLADALQWVIEHPDESAAIAKRGVEVVHERFEINRALEPLIELLRQRLGQTSRKNPSSPVAQHRPAANLHPEPLRASS